MRPPFWHPVDRLSVRYQGDMNRRERDEAVDAFMRNNRVSGARHCSDSG